MPSRGREEGELEIRTAYCSACDRNVRVVYAPRQPNADRPPAASDLVCLEYGERCTGDMCPLFDVPSDEMRKNLKRLLEGTGRPPAGR